MKRILITGLATYWGGRLAQVLEEQPAVDLIVGVDRHAPTVELDRTEFVRVREDYGALRRIVEAAEIDTILHTHLLVDSTAASSRQVHELNVIGTMNLLAAAATTDSPVRRLIVKSSTLVYGAGRGDPQIFRETARRSNSPRTQVERSLLEVEDYVRDFAEDNPHVSVTLLRVANVIAPDFDTPMLNALHMPAVPAVFGFDPLVQFVHVEDCVSALAYAVENDLPGIFNVAADGVIPWSEVRGIIGKPAMWLPPLGTQAAAGMLRRSHIVDLPDEFLSLLRFGRGVDNVRLKQVGFRYRYSTVGCLYDFAEGLRLRRVIGAAEQPTYEYQEDLEQFLHRHTVS
ncbi:MAG: NAD-dependent epimerase/dehydratase family protein [Acidimicrobiia bacterium]|nr:NAD-dependent epimerase/dehydratase family protein [Acidimicrobiia bacterium]